MQSPSHEFMTRQAVLNTVAKRYPFLIKERSAASIIGQITLNGQWIAGTPELVQAIQAEYRALAARYEVAA